MLDSLNLRNNITFQTHISGHTLDLIIDDQTEPLVKCVKRGHTFADHSLVQATIGIEKHIPLDKSVTYRKFKNINKLEFSRDLNDHLTECGTHEELEAKIDCYNRVILATLDKHAPQKTKLVKVSYKQPWFTDRIKDEIRVRWKKELSWIKDPNDYTYQAFCNQRRYCSNLIKSAQRQFFKGKITENCGNYKEIFRITNKLLGREDELPLPPAEDLITQANEFNDFFIGKIEKIMQDLAPSSMTATLNEYLELTYETTNRLTNFKMINDQDILSIINRAPPKSCELDPMPTTLLKVHRKVIAPHIKDIVNTSVVSGRFTRNIKQAFLRPLLKKKGLDLTLNNYRPVYNLAYILKIIERVVCDQLTFYIANSVKIEKLQLAYKQGHSTETAMLKVKTDILDAIDQRKVVCLVLLDLSVAFDTVNHNHLLNHLKYRFGVVGTALAWLTDYLKGRTQKVVLDGTHGHIESDAAMLKCGVPQGSVLGPILFTLYISPLGDICRNIGVDYHNYADD